MSEAAEHNAAGVAGGNAPAPETPAAFPNRLEVLRYLQAEGWQISQTQFYAHCREGRLPRQPDGGYLRRDADRYAKNHCRRLETGERVNDTLSRLAEKKAHLEVAREETRLERDRHDLAVRRGEYLPRAEVELMIVGRAVAMLAHLKSMCRMKAPEWIGLVEGRQERGRELIAAVESGIEEHMAVFARDVEFEVLLEKSPAPAESKEKEES